MREEAKVRSEQRSFSSAICKSAIEVGLHQESPGGFGGVCWHFWHRSSTGLTEIRHLVDSLSGSDEQTLSKFSLIEYHFVFDRGWQPVCFYKPWYAGLVCTDLRSADSFFSLISDILDLLWTCCQTLCASWYQKSQQLGTLVTPLTFLNTNNSRYSSVQMSYEIKSTGFYQLFYSKWTTELNWSPCSNVVAVNQWVLRLLWRLTELILEGASLYLRTAPAPNLPAMTRRTHTMGATEGGWGAAGWISSKLSGVEHIKSAKEQQFEIILINNVPVKGDNWDNSG